MGENKVLKVLGGIVGMVVITLMTVYIVKDTLNIINGVQTGSRQELLSVAEGDASKAISEKTQNSLIGKAEQKLLDRISKRIVKKAEEKNGDFIPACIIEIPEADRLVLKDKEGNEIKVRLIGLETAHRANDMLGLAETTIGFEDVLVAPYEELFVQYGKGGADEDGYLPAYIWCYSIASPEKEQDVETYMLNAALISNGVANNITDGINTEHDEQFARLCAEAKRDGVGLWTNPSFAELWR